MKFDREVVSASAAASATGSTHLHSGCDSDVTVDVELGEATELRIVTEIHKVNKSRRPNSLVERRVQTRVAAFDCRC